MVYMYIYIYICYNIKSLTTYTLPPASEKDNSGREILKKDNSDKFEAATKTILKRKIRKKDEDNSEKGQLRKRTFETDNSEKETSEQMTNLKREHLNKRTQKKDHFEKGISGNDNSEKQTSRKGQLRTEQF